MARQQVRCLSEAACAREGPHVSREVVELHRLHGVGNVEEPEEGAV